MSLCRAKDLKRYIDNAVEVDPDRPVLVDKYLDRADELDVDALCDKDGNVVIAGIMQHIEQAGVHSGGAALLAEAHHPCVLPVRLLFAQCTAWHPAGHAAISRPDQSAACNVSSPWGTHAGKHDG